MMKLENLISWRLVDEIAIPKIQGDQPVLIKGNLRDERDLYICEKYSYSKVVTFTYDSDVGLLLAELEGFNIELCDTGDPVEYTTKVVQELANFSSTIVLDITGLATEVIFMLIRACKEIQFDNIMAVYVQPEEYKSKRDDILVPDFLLSEARSSISPIPGFMVLPKDLPSILLAFLGFEGGRFQELCEHVLTEGDTEITPVLPLPSYVAGWHIQGLYSNLSTLKDLNKLNSLKRITAWDPFMALNLLEGYYVRYAEDYQITVAPLGTKPHILATALFAVRHDDVIVMYDNPKVPLHRSNGVGIVRGYNLKGLFT